VAGPAANGVNGSGSQRKPRQAFHYNAAMADRAEERPGSSDAPVSNRTYASVLLVQALVLIALWAAARYFGTP
jgi:hypothetical protein